MRTAGLLIVVLGLLILVMAKFLVPFLSKGYQARNPDKDPAKHDRFQKIYALSFAAFFLIVGAVLFVLGLLTGGSVGFDTWQAGLALVGNGGGVIMLCAKRTSVRLSYQEPYSEKLRGGNLVEVAVVFVMLLGVVALVWVLKNIGNK
jgi:hypothetical protein